MRKGVTPVISTVILILVAIGLLSFASTYITQFYTESIKYIFEIYDTDCVFFDDGGVIKKEVQIYIKNTGNDAMTIGLSGAGDCSGTTQIMTCGDVTIIKYLPEEEALTKHPNKNFFDTETIEVGGFAVFSDVCSSTDGCKYKVQVEGRVLDAGAC